MLSNVNLKGVPIPNITKLILNKSEYIHAISWAEHLTSLVVACFTLYRNIQVIFVYPVPPPSSFNALTKS